MIKKIAVIGAGTMGHGIAEAFAIYGYQVNMYDIKTEFVDAGLKAIKEELTLLAQEEVIKESAIEETMARIHPFTCLADAVKDRDYVIEATPERIELKLDLFKQLDQFCPEHTIFASNTSSLALASMLVAVSEERKKRMLVNHWYNPAHLMPLVEISDFGNMPQEILQEVKDLYKSIHKQTAVVLKDVPGLVANRIQQGVAREVFSLIEQGIAEPKEIDKALKFGPAFRYATTGQLEVADFGGLDIWCIVGDNLLSVMDASKQANPILRKKIEEGKLGLKSGEGFFKYDAKTAQKIKQQFLKKLIHQLKASEYYVD